MHKPIHKHTGIHISKKKSLESGEMSQWSRILDALAEDTSLVSSVHMVLHNPQ